jgi:hypothetical protein
MRLPIERFIRRRTAGVTIPEVLVASLVVGLLVMADMVAVYHMRVLNAKDADRGIVAGFMQHYVELVKALPFDEVKTNAPLSGLYNGANGTPRVAIPATSEWMPLSDVNYQLFHPSLLWLTNRNPQLRVSLENASVAGAIHDKHLLLEVEWDAPLARGPRQSHRLHVLRVKDI